MGRSREACCLLLFAVLSTIPLGCGTGALHFGPTPEERREAAATAVKALQAGRFTEASRLSSLVLAKDARNPQAAAVRAVATYVEAAARFWDEAQETPRGAGESDGFGWGRLREAMARMEGELARAQKDIEAAADPAFTLELCLACWQRDWNGDDVLDERDRRLLEVELDQKGQPMPEGDPRRRPTFRFDAGDVSWAHATASFQRAALDVALAYRWDALSSLSSGQEPQRIVIELADVGRVRQAKELLLAGLSRAGEAREAYLAETDDDREWVPGPRQKSHPLPLDVDDSLYRKWGDTLRDLTRLVEGKEGIRVADIARLDRDRAMEAPAGFINVGSLLDRPGDIVIDAEGLKLLDPRTREGVEAALDLLFGKHYVDEMAPSPLPARLLRMQDEITKGEETLGIKLRYLLWLN